MNIKENTTNYSCLELAWKNINENDDVKNLIPTVAALGAGILLFPHSFPIGIVVGSIYTGIVIGSISAMGMLKFEIPQTKIVFISDKFNSDMLHLIKPIFVTIIGPLGEELLFRGSIPLLSHAIVYLIPNASAVLFGPFNVSVVISIVATSILFGLLHDDLSKIKIIGGLVYGILGVYFGLAAAVGAHMMHNTIAVSPRYLLAGDKIENKNISEFKDIFEEF
jgi:membrane protease YdiL (CAAX protease family)